MRKDVYRSGCTWKILCQCYQVKIVVAVVVLWLSSLMCFAQQGQGAINGRVVDQTGSVIVNATVEIKNVDTGVVNTTVTNDAGHYQVQSLNPGTYTISVNARGFEALMIDQVLVSAAATVEEDATLHVGKETVRVTVQANADLLSNVSDVSTTVDQQIVENLPYPERSSLEAVLLVPGVVGDTLNPGGISPENPNAYTNYFSPGASLTIGGTPPGTTAIIIDGSDVLEASFPRAGLNLSGYIVRETSVIVAGASAQYGRTGGGVIVENSRGGTNEYHGAITWRHTDPWWNAYPLGTSAKNDLHENFYGFYIGGPVRIPKLYDGRNRTFFMIGVEPARMRQALSFRGTFLTPDELAGKFHNSVNLLNSTILRSQGYAAALAAPRIGGIGYTAPNAVSSSNPQGLFPYGVAYTSTSQYQQINGPLSDCTSGQADFVAPTVCHDDLSALLAANPFAQFVASQMPTPANPGPYVRFDNAQGTPDTNLQNATYERGVQNFDNRYSVRIDQQFNNSNAMFVRYTVVPIEADRFFALAVTNPMNQVPTDVEMGRDVAIGYTHVFSNTVVNNFHYSWFRENLQRLPPLSTRNKDYGAQYGLTPATIGYGFPGVGSFSGTNVTYTIQPGTTVTSQQIDQNFILGDDLTITKGRHNITTGFDWRWIQSNQYDLSGLTGGKYSFSNTSSQAPNNNPAGSVIGGGNGFATLIEAESGFSNTPLSVPGYYRYKYWGAYFQDNWRATPQLTLNIGLRYEVQVPREEAHDNQAYVSATPIAGTLNGIATTTAFCFSNACGLGGSLWPTNYWGLQPRLGIAYAATPKMTIRASYAITRPPLSGQENIPDPDFNVTGSSAPVVSNYVTDYISNPIAPSSLVSAYTQLNGARGPFNFSTGLAPVFVDQTSAMPTVQIYNMTVQYQPFSRMLVQASYQGSRGTHLYGQFLGKNTPPLDQVQGAVQQGALYLPGNIPGGNTYQIKATNNVSGSVLNETYLQQMEPYQNFFNQTMTDIYVRNGDSHYNALYLSLNQRATKTLTLLSYYTWSKSLDNVPDINNGAAAGSGQSVLQTPYSLNNEYSVSTFDQDSALKAGYNFDFPFGFGQNWVSKSRFVNEIIGNWSTSGIMTWVAGYPNYVQLGGNGYFNQVVPSGITGCTATGSSHWCSGAVLPSGYVLRPNIVSGVPLINKNWKKNPFYTQYGALTSYLNANAFSMPGSINNPQIGNAPRTLANARSPREFLFDMRVAKGFQVKERYHLNLTIQASNIFNHPVYFGIASHTAYNTVSGTTTVNGGPASQVYNPVSNPNSSFATLSASNSQGMSRVVRIGAEFKF